MLAKRFKRLGFGLILSGSIILFALATIEIVLRKAAPLPDPFHLAKQVRGNASRYIPKRFPPHVCMETVVEEGLPGMSGTKRFTINEMGFRGEPIERDKPDDEYRVFLIGGSTTECVYLDDTECLTQKTQDALQPLVPHDKRVKVYGAARSGDQTMDHIAILSQLIVHLEPDAVAVYCGINDLYLGIAGHDYFIRPEPMNEKQNLAQALLGMPWKQRLTDFQIGRYMHKVVNRLESTSHEAGKLQAITLRTDYRSHVEQRKRIPELDRIPEMDVDTYRNNLLTLAGIAETHSVKLYFITQPSTWNSKVDPKASEWNWAMFDLPDGRRVTFPESLLDEKLEAYNDVMRNVARKKEVSLIDFARELPKSLECFYDHCHFNVKGADMAARTIASHWEL